MRVGQESGTFPWNDEEEPRGSPGRFIAVSGNTGSGKSTLVASIERRLKELRTATIGINERSLHHPILKLMFRFPMEYSFFVQSNFALQRAVVLYRWLSLGYTVVMERSHLDDPLFVEHHFRQGHMTERQYECYQEFATVLQEKIPDPDIYVFLSASPSLSLSRLKESEQSGERPIEFPDDDVKASFVTAWYQAFEEHFKKLQGLKTSGQRFDRTTLLRFEAEKPTEQMTGEIVKSFLGIQS